MSTATNLVEAGFIPDAFARRGIRSLLRKRLVAERVAQHERGGTASFAEALAQGPLAVETQAANDQHYEVPAAFYTHCLGRHLKYSSCFYASDSDDLDQAEANMLALTMDRAELQDGQHILEIGCGWGSLTVAMAERYPSARITAISNSASQKEHILQRLAAKNLNNVTIITANLLHWEGAGRFDRIVSVECFEHMRNYAELFKRLASWLNPDGLVFFHVFCHKELPYLFEDRGDDDWMARHFFSGGTMPSFDLFQHFRDGLEIKQQWAVNGTHYGRTSRHWLEKLDAHKQQALAVLEQDLSPKAARTQFRRWRLFFMACEECFNYNHGDEWFVGHYLLRAQS